MSTSSAKASRPSDAELTNAYNSQRQELQQTASKISELEADASEHQLVLDTLREAYKKEPERKCFRLIGGILVERTVEETLPSVEGNLENLTKVIKQLGTTYKQKDEAFAAFIKTNQIQVVSK